LKKYLSSFLVLFLLWVFVGGTNTAELILGGIVAAILSYVISDYLNISIGTRSITQLGIFIIMYIPVLTIELIKANLDVAKRVLDPNLPLNPGFVKVPTHIKNDLGKLTLANSITLTPGTLSIDADEENVYIHWIDVKGQSPEDYQTQVSSKFEKILGRIFND